MVDGFENVRVQMIYDAPEKNSTQHSYGHMSINEREEIGEKNKIIMELNQRRHGTVMYVYN